MTLIRRSTSLLALLTMVFSLFADQVVELCRGCDSAETAEHSCCDKSPGFNPATTVGTVGSPGTAPSGSGCVNCVQVVLRLQMTAGTKSVVESPPQLVSERFVPPPVVPRSIASPVRLDTDFNSPPRLLRTVQLLI